MMNNITQVSPGNRVDFSRIRKALQGVKIPKFLNAGRIYNFDSFFDNLPTNQFQRNQTNSSIAWTPNWNDQAGKYATVADHENSDQYKAFTDYVINNAGTDSRVMDYLKLLELSTTGNGHSSILFDANGNLNQNWADEYRRLRTDGKYGYYHLSPDGTVQEESKPQSEVSAVEEPVKSEPAKEPFKWTPTEYQPTQTEEQQSKFRFPTFPLYNAALLGVANITNKRILDTQLKAPSMRYTFTPRVATLERPYVEQQQNEQKLQEYKWDIQQLLNNTNDLGRAQDAYRDVRGKELDTQMQNNLRQSDIYRQSKENVTNTVNYNKAGWDQNANQNRLAWVGEAKDRLNAISQYQAQLGQNLQENIMSNYTDWKAWNRNNMLQDYADWQSAEGAKVQADLQAAFDEYQNSGDITKYKGYNDFWNGIMNGANPIDDKGFGTGYARYLTDNRINDSAEAREKFFRANYNNEKYKNQLTGLLEGFDKYKSDALNQYIKSQLKINTSWGLTKARYNPLQFNGEVSPWMWRAMNGAPPSYKRQYMKKGGRFLEYLEHNRRAEKEIRDTTMQSIQNGRKLLARDLDALDRESLLLLRAIFK